MRKAEQQARTREKNSRRLLSDVYSAFAHKANETLLYLIYAREFDFGVLQQTSHPFCRLMPPGGADVSFIYFKRDQSVQDLEWSESYRRLSIFRT